MPQVSVKGEIVEAATSVFRRSGFHGASIQDIAVVAGVPKGSVYNHFTSKVDLARVVVQRYAEGTSTGLLKGDSPALIRIRAHLEAELTRTRESGLEFGCLLGNMAQELGDEGLAELREVVDASFKGWINALAEAIDEAQQTHEIASTLEAHALAGLIIDALEGTALRTKALGTTEALDGFVDMVFATILD